MSENKRPLVVLTGPTAVGKTALSTSLAKAINGEIISADSMQVYKYMDIGTAKIKPEEMNGIKHFLIDTHLPDEPFNVVVFQQEAKAAMNDIWQRGKIPVLVGGTGFYIQAVLNDIDFDANNDDISYRHSLETLAMTKGNIYLHEMLKEADPESAEQIHFNNVKKVIRALEFYHQTGKKISEHNTVQRQNTSPYNFAYFVLNHDRAVLYNRIEQRIDQMLNEGLVLEVQNLLKRGYTKDMISMQGLGYKEIIDYLEGRTTLEEAVSILKRDTRHFAKRQLTWFRREREVIWMDKTLFPDETAILEAMLQILKEKGII